jgi:hypothetical protein
MLAPGFAKSVGDFTEGGVSADGGEDVGHEVLAAEGGGAYGGEALLDEGVIA